MFLSFQIHLPPFFKKKKNVFEKYLLKLFTQLCLETRKASAIFHSLCMLTASSQLLFSHFLGPTEIENNMYFRKLSSLFL